VDEVLAVGDVNFQAKCLGKMEDVGKSGRTVLFVSHNMQAVTRLCDRCLLLDHGTLIEDGPSHQVTAAYVGLGVDATSVRQWDNPDTAPGDEVVRLRAVRVCNKSGELDNSFDIREPVGIELEYDVLEDGHHFLPHFHLTNDSGTTVFVSVDLDPDWRGKRRPQGRYRSRGWIPGNMLAEGPFSVSACLMTLNPTMLRVLERDAALFRTIDPMSAADTARGDYQQPMPGVLRPALKWKTRYEPAEAGAVVQLP